MAKVSISPEKRGIMQFISEALEENLESTGMEPINHIPYVDVYSNPEEIVMEVEIAGVRREDIEVTIFKNTINVKAVKYECFKDTGINYICMERSFGRIFRAIDVPVCVNTSEIKATYHDGILRIVMPRVEEKRGQPKRIHVEPER